MQDMDGIIMYGIRCDRKSVSYYYDQVRAAYDEFVSNKCDKMTTEMELYLAGFRAKLEYLEQLLGINTERAQSKIEEKKDVTKKKHRKK